MNINVILGTIAFSIWSVFSVWFYLNFVKEFDNHELAETTIKVEETIAVEKPIPVIEEVKVEEIVETPVSINLSKIYSFEINSDVVLDQEGLEAFVNEVKNTVDGRSVSIQITGHTCDLGTEEYNNALGLKRAKSVENILSTGGFENIDVQSAGESNPVAPNDTENNRAKNRRVTISITTIS